MNALLWFLMAAIPQDPPKKQEDPKTRIWATVTLKGRTLDGYLDLPSFLVQGPDKKSVRVHAAHVRVISFRDDVEEKLKPLLWLWKYGCRSSEILVGSFPVLPKLTLHAAAETVELTKDNLRSFRVLFTMDPDRGMPEVPALQVGKRVEVAAGESCVFASLPRAFLYQPDRRELRLVDLTTGAELWSRTYDHPMTSLVLEEGDASLHAIRWKNGSDPVLVRISVADGAAEEGKLPNRPDCLIGASSRFLFYLADGKHFLHRYEFSSGTHDTYKTCVRPQDSMLPYFTSLLARFHPLEGSMYYAGDQYACGWPDGRRHFDRRGLVFSAVNFGYPAFAVGALGVPLRGATVLPSKNLVIGWVNDTAMDVFRGDTFDRVATIPIGEKAVTAIRVAGDRLVLRTETALVSLEIAWPELPPVDPVERAAMPGSKKPVACILTDDAVLALFPSRDRDEMYAVLSYEPRILVLDTKTHRISGEIPLPSRAVSCFPSPNGRRLLVLRQKPGGGTLASLLDLAERKSVEEFEFKEQAWLQGMQIDDSGVVFGEVPQQKFNLVLPSDRTQRVSWDLRYVRGVLTHNGKFLFGWGQGLMAVEWPAKPGPEKPKSWTDLLTSSQLPADLTNAPFLMSPDDQWMLVGGSVVELFYKRSPAAEVKGRLPSYLGSPSLRAKPARIAGIAEDGSLETWDAKKITRTSRIETWLQPTLLARDRSGAFLYASCRRGGIIVYREE